MRPSARIFVVIYTSLILLVCFYPGTFSPWPKQRELYWVPWNAGWVLRDALLNLLFYVPAGFSAVLGTDRNPWKTAAVVVLGSCLSLTVEYFQMWAPSRYGNYNDWLMNSIGTALGAAAAHLYRRATLAEH